MTAFLFWCKVSCSNIKSNCFDADNKWEKNELFWY